MSDEQTETAEERSVRLANESNARDAKELREIKGELSSRVASAKEDLAEWAVDGAKREVDDAIADISDSNTPIYHRDIWACLYELSFGDIDMSELGGYDDFSKLVQVAIYLHIEQELREYWSRELEDLPTCAECGDRILPKDDDAEVETETGITPATDVIDTCADCGDQYCDKHISKLRVSKYAPAGVVCGVCEENRREEHDEQEARELLAKDE